MIENLVDMSELNELLVQQKALNKKVLEVQQAKKSITIEAIKKLLITFAIGKDELFPQVAKVTTAKTNSPKSKVAQKYADPVTGATWSGRGVTPKWIAGKNRDDFLIVPASTNVSPV